jgi:two-component system response regulator HydG
MVKRVAPGQATVLIQGETGTGKELVARAIHDQSQRKGKFVAINCSAMPENLLESELFGHMAGSFTDAHATRQGLFVEAEGGTVFLDEIGEMPLGMQAKLLRTLQEKVVRPIGSSREIPFDARIVAATNRKLEGEVAAKRFREDLYYRVNVVTIEVPPLRARSEDILPLAHHFLKRLKKQGRAAPLRLGHAVAERLVAHSWPGNVRELENCMERAVALALFDEITVSDLPSDLRLGFAAKGASPTEELDTATMALVERNYIQKVMEAVGGNKTAAARVLGFDRRTLYRKLSLPEPEVAAAADDDAPP